MQYLNDEIVKVGMNQTIRAIKGKTAKKVYFASDASEFMLERIEIAIRESGEDVPVISYESMKKLGNACGISRNAVCAVVIKLTQKEDNE